MGRWKNQTIWLRAVTAVACTVFRLCAALIRVMPNSIGYGFGRLVSLMLYCVDGEHRRTTLANLERVYGTEMTPAERRRLARRVYRNLGYNFVEFCKIPAINKETLDSFATIDGFENVEKALQHGKGALFIGGHIGNWELMGPLGSLLGMTASVVVRPIDSPQFDNLIESYRQSHGTGIIGKKRAALSIMRKLRRNECIGLLVDQRPHRDALVVDFMGHPASTTTIPAEIAIRTGAAVIPAYAVRERPGHVRLVFEPELELQRSDDLESDVLENTRRFQNVITRVVRRYPDQWLWPHRRWKSPKPRHFRGYYRARRADTPEPEPADSAVPGISG